MMRDARCLAATTLMTALALAGCGGESSGEAQRARPAPAPPPAEEPRSAARTPAQEILSVLSVEHEVDLLAERDGIVVEILHDEGSRVQKETILARLDDRELRAKLERAHAELEVAQNNVKFNEAELKARQAHYRRAQEMRRLGLNSEADLEEAEFRAKGAEYDLASWRAIVERTRADIRVLEVELDKTRVRAPFGGVVARRYIRTGQNVLKDEKCFRLSELYPLQVRFLVPETAAHRPRPGDVVNVAPVSDSQRVYPARILRISPVVDPASGSYDVTAQLTGPDLQELRPGMSVRVLWEPAPPSPPR
ncbi:MAG: efflux RND transporter periplasmic adaptor subunit [Acidobacteria bacterium]|nr:efflux RND transporter periplasmic adaptor subunit [Acidobacteriota bacterium]